MTLLMLALCPLVSFTVITYAIVSAPEGREEEMTTQTERFRSRRSAPRESFRYADYEAFSI